MKLISIAFAFSSIFLGLILGANVSSSTARKTSATIDTGPLVSNETKRMHRDVFRPKAIGHPSFISPHANPIAILGQHVFVVNTPADTVDLINTQTQLVEHRIHVGIDPVSIAMRPDGKEVWVSNHVSDSVSVIDTDPNSPTFRHVVATIQDFDQQTKSTRFDEPVGLAFANNQKAYVALSLIHI